MCRKWRARENKLQSVHEELADNMSTMIQAKGTTKSNAELNFFSNIGFIQYFGKSKYRSDV